MVAKKRIKRKSHEKLTDVNIQHVMGLLQAESPITKKEACSILNISYNTTRLNSIIEEFVEKVKKTKSSKNQSEPKYRYDLDFAVKKLKYEISTDITEKDIIIEKNK